VANLDSEVRYSGKDRMPSFYPPFPSKMLIFNRYAFSKAKILRAHDDDDDDDDITGATGIVTRSLRQNLVAVPGKNSIHSLQKTAILGTSHIIRKVL
jgi:hypothetical protein